MGEVMNIIELAKQAGINAEADTLCRNEGWIEPLEAFAKLVVANIDPKSFMSWQEGYAAGAAHEREECAKVCDDYDVKYDVNTCDTAEGIALEIRARGTT
jgi:hypothetical protein